MTTKITLDPQLVRVVLGIEYEIDTCINDNDNGIIKYARKRTDRDKGFIDIHRFVYLAIEWCAGKGWQMRIEVWGIGFGKITVCDESDNRITFSYGKQNKYPDRLSAELAAISFVWEQIQKEKKDEN